MRVPRALEGLPLIAGALSRGELSYSKARALTRVATPATEPHLVELAKSATASHIDTFIRHYRRVDADEADARHEARGVTWFYDDDGMLVSQTRLEPQDATSYIAAITAATADAPKSVPAGTSCGCQHLRRRLARSKRQMRPRA